MLGKMSIVCRSLVALSSTVLIHGLVFLGVTLVQPSDLFGQARAKLDPQRAKKTFHVSDYVYALDRNSSDILFINPQTDRIDRTITLSSRSERLDLVPGTKFAVATSKNTRKALIVDLESSQIRHVVNFKIAPDLVALAADGSVLAIAEIASGALYLFDPYKGMQLAGPLTFSDINDLRFGKKSSRLYISTLAASQLFVLDLPTGKLLNTIKLPSSSGVSHFSRTPSGRLGVAVMPGPDRPQVVPIDLQLNTALKNVSVGHPVYRSFVTPSGSHVFLPAKKTGQVSLYSIDKHAIVKTLKMSEPVHMMGPGLLGISMYAASRSGDRLWQIDLESFAVRSTIQLPAKPERLAVHEGTAQIYLSFQDDSGLAIVDSRFSSKEFNKSRLLIFLERKPFGIASVGMLGFCH